MVRCLYSWKSRFDATEFMMGVCFCFLRLASVVRRERMMQ